MARATCGGIRLYHNQLSLSRADESHVYGPATTKNVGISQDTREAEMQPVHPTAWTYTNSSRWELRLAHG